MQVMKEMTSQPLSSFSHEWKFVPQQIVPIEATKSYAAVPDGMVKIPGGDFYFKVNGIEIEGDNDIGVDVQYPWEDSPRRGHSHNMQIRAFWMDQYPVTNARFKRFLDRDFLPARRQLEFSEGLEGRQLSRWLGEQARHLGISRRRPRLCKVGREAACPMSGSGNTPRQGNADGRIYPWGNEWNASAVPVPDKDRTLRGPDDVNAHDQSAELPLACMI